MATNMNASRPTSRQQPIGEAVSTAFQDANAANTMSPELLEQITQNVIRKLQDTGLENLTPTASHQSTQPPAQYPQPYSDTQPPSFSPSTSNLGPKSPPLPASVFTPASSHKPADHLGSTLPLLPKTHGQEAATSPNRGRSHATLSPHRPGSPMSQSSMSSDSGRGESTVRPKGPARLHTGVEETTLEKIWGPLFDEQGKSTPRLGQFLRGLAVHIIDEFEPRHSLVITPDKMVNYYKTVALKSDIYPWSVVFDDERSSISRMYRELSCQHHLIQEHFDERPDIPGLTPGGFERWVVLLIRANPDSEYERLTKALLEMPIDNPDNKKERFPKEITRRLFPTHADFDVRYRIEDAMMEHASIEIPRPQRSASGEATTHGESPTKKSHVDQKAPPRPSVSFAEPEIIQETPLVQPTAPTQHERPPHAYVSDPTPQDEAEAPEPPTSKTPIERERKPYVAQVGGGRSYEPEELRPRDSTSRQRGNSVASSGGDHRPSRSDSTSTHTRPIPINTTTQQVPKPEIHQSHYNGGAASNTYRRRSPSFSEARRPDLDLHGGYRSTFDPGSLPRSTANAPPVFDESDTKRYFENQARDRARRKADEDAHAYGDSPRRHSSLKPKRTDYASEDEYWRARDKRDRSYDDENRYRDLHGNYR